MTRHVPRHLGLIMDGNGRWASARGLPRSTGHLAGLQHIRPALLWCRELGISTVSGYLWSTENWTRPVDEVQYMRLLLRTYGRSFAQQLHEQKIRIVHSGSTNGLTNEEQHIISDAVALTQTNGSLVFNLVFNSSGRADLVQVAQRLVRERVAVTQIDEQMITNTLATAGLPDIDFVIRTAGEQRLSNFLLWQMASAQVHAVATYWPALTRHELEHALRQYRPLSRIGTLPTSRRIIGTPGVRSGE